MRNSFFLMTDDFFPMTNDFFLFYQGGYFYLDGYIPDEYSKYNHCDAANDNQGCI